MVTIYRATPRRNPPRSRLVRLASSFACVFAAAMILGSDPRSAPTEGTSVGGGQIVELQNSGPGTVCSASMPYVSSGDPRFYMCFLSDPGQQLAPPKKTHQVTDPQATTCSEGSQIQPENSPAPNELGKIMIVMYHDIQSEEKEWVRSRENFRNDLERFYREGFVLIRLSSYLRGEIDVPAGKTPLILTFDDATPGQFRFIEKEGQLVPDPGCAVGILLDFYAKHPDFGCAATFFIDFPAPFGVASQAGAKLKFLLENGMEIGNHTYNHRNLRESSPEQIAEELGKLAKTVKDMCGYEVCSLALPYGGYPRYREVLASGVWEGSEYRNLGVLLVGAEPAPSPFSRNFKPLAIPRIRGSDEELSKWLAYFARNPSAKFVSDGEPDVITVPRSEENNLDPDRVGARAVLSYEKVPGYGQSVPAGISPISMSTGS